MFYNLKVCGNPELSKAIGSIVVIASAPSVSLCHILIILTIRQALHEQKDYNSLKAQMIGSIFISNKVFEN